MNQMLHVIIVDIEAIEKYSKQYLYNNNYRAIIAYKEFPCTHYYKDISYGHITSSDIFLLSLGAVEERNKRESASPKSIADTCVQYCHRGCP